jgi:hypothetical protein
MAQENYVVELITCIAVSIERLTAAQLVIIFIHSMEPVRFITVFTTASTGPYPKPDESSPLSHSIPLKPIAILPAAYFDLVGTMTRQSAGTRNRYSCPIGPQIYLFFKVPRHALHAPATLTPRKYPPCQLNEWLNKSQSRS